MGRQHIVDHHFDEIDLTREVLFERIETECSRYAGDAGMIACRAAREQR
jgi:hypothetical protein